ncbi:MAG: phenylalanine--tRNA ligase subunit alpha, partial [Lachnospiraceae bacterium]
MKERLEQIRQKALQQISESETLEKLNEVRVNILGKKGELTDVLKGMKDVAPEDRPKIGQLVNDARAVIESKLEEATKKMERMKREMIMKSEVIDVTLPAQKAQMGHRHPITIAMEELE